MTSLDEPVRNRLLAALWNTESACLTAHLERVPLRLGDMLYAPGEQLLHVYFPTTAIVSLHHVMASGASCEIAGVGNEGVVGVSLFLGGQSTSSSAVVQTSGHAYRLHRHTMRQEFDRQGLMQRVLLRYAQALFTQAAQTAACNRFHSITQCLCRWLLETLDRIPTSELVITQELIANMLGVRREGITDAAGRLQQEGLIRYRRGHISVLDRVGLEAKSCECYSVVKTEIARLLADVLQPAEDRAQIPPTAACPPRG